MQAAFDRSAGINVKKYPAYFRAHSMILASSREVQGHTVSLSEPLMQSLKAENQANEALSLKTQPICLAVLIPQSSHRLLGRRPCDPQAVAFLVHTHLQL